ncbi:MAG: P-loop NTPase [Candidatus Zixiibacteriota bacterium]|nr:MAG: P-loop NTPase [candidate division Zixibacteria bacterium]
MSDTDKQSPFNDTIQSGLSRVKNIIAVASGKGGVGKSTLSVNLAVALKQTGATVGLMDADIYGPSQPGMLGSKDARPDISSGQLKPISKHGIDFISMGLLVSDDTPVIWRAPIAMKMIQQFIGAVTWGDLDYLLIDLPPGTGDVQLTLAQQASLTGAIIVTTPQQVALGVAHKGLRMFQQVNVPIVGIIENMSGFTCEHCGKSTAIFKEGGGKQMAESLSVPYLGAIPLDPAIMESAEEGIPIVTNGTETAAAKAFIGVAEKVKEYSEQIRQIILKHEPKKIQMSRDGNLQITWPDDHQSVFTPHNLRINCACASCIDENTGKKTLDVKQVPLDMKITGVNPVGRYGLAISFSDGHNTGIYILERMRELCECDICARNRKQDSFSI